MTSGSANESTIHSSIQRATWVPGRLGTDHGEAIAADARGRGGLAGRALQPVRELFQHLVAGMSGPGCR